MTVPDPPESAQQWYRRVSAELETHGYRDLDWATWSSWPFEGDLRPRPLTGPAAETARGGTGGVDCFICAAVEAEDTSYVFWHDERALLGVPNEAQSLPFAAFLMPREHADLRDLPPATAARMGELLAAIERAACDVLDVPRIQVARWGDGQEHLHWWLFARPTGMLQLRGTFLSHWGDILPTRDRQAARADLDLVAARLVEIAGGHAVPAG
ncbi:HIT family protein [Occultella aeris]|uniref:HIT family protein n=1 Tax=Occultella aeris TaxID=2761496 RepID=UPI0012EADFBC|nr:hypothetical protein [Occultella aeris]